MDPWLIGALSFIAFLTLLFLGMPVAFAMGLTGIIGYGLVGGWPHTQVMVGMIPWDKVTMYSLTVVPLFVLMGTLTFHAGFGRDIYHSARQWVGHFPGGLAQATVVGNAIFAAATGSSVAATATFSKIAVPEMRRHGYDPGLATGSVAAGGTMAAMIPPSIAMVLYGMITEQSIAMMLIAGFLPGLLEAVTYMVQIYIRTRLNPRLGGALPAATWRERLAAIKGVGAVLFLVVCVMGSIYTGIATPTEAGAAGAFGALVLGFATRRLNLRVLWQALIDSTKVVGALFCIVVGAFLFNQMLVISHIPDMSTLFIAGLAVPPMVILIGFMILFLILGCFMSGIAIMYLCIPTVYPITIAMGWDPIWFGIIFISVYEIGMITPPFGITLFAAKAAIGDISMETIIRGIGWFLVCDMVRVALLIAFPQIALFLPSTMR